MSYVIRGSNLKRQNYNILDLIHYGIKKTVPGYHLIRMASPHAWSGNLTSRDLAHDTAGFDEEQALVSKFFKKYPEIKYSPVSGPLTTEYGGRMKFTHPASVFIRKQKRLMKQGYTEKKAFELVEAEIADILDKEREQTRILRGVALDQNAYSYLDRFQMIAETESMLKLQRLERDMPKFLRAQKKYVKDLREDERRIQEEAAAAAGMTTEEWIKRNGGFEAQEEEPLYSRESIEEILYREHDDDTKQQKFEKYQPVLYQIVKDPKELYERESLTETHDRFLERTERLLRIHH